MGRTLVFLARIMQDGWSKSPREVAIDEKSAVLVEPDGKGTVLGSGKGAYFLRPTQEPETCKKGEPLTFQKISVYRVPTGGHFDLTSWTGDGGTAYSLSVEKGKIDSTQAGHCHLLIRPSASCIAPGETDIFALPFDFVAIPCETSAARNLSLRYVMSRHLHYFPSRSSTFEQLRFLLEAGELEAGL